MTYLLIALVIGAFATTVWATIPGLPEEDVDASRGRVKGINNRINGLTKPLSRDTLAEMEGISV